MSWFDLASLVVVSWQAARSYWQGFGRAFSRLLALPLAMAGAVYLQQFLVLYLVREWRALDVIAGLLKNRPRSVPVFQSYGASPAGFAEKVVHYFPHRLDLPVLAGGEISHVARAAVVLVMVSFLLFFLLLSALLDNLGAPGRGQKRFSLLSFACGACSGLFTLVIICLAADLFLQLFPVPILDKDFYSAYSCRAVNYLVQGCLALLGLE